MKQLVTHLLHGGIDKITEQSILNCHAVGLHSIMLLNSPEQTIRLYVAYPHNELARNNDEDLSNFSLAFHPHHCDITIQVVKGTIFNWVVQNTDNPNSGFEMDCYKYNSEITNGKIGFKKASQNNIINSVRKEYISAGESVYMNASELHTVGASDKHLSAWFVFEGKEDKFYNNIAYSNADLENFDSSELYKKPTKFQVMDMLSDCGLYDKDRWH